MRVRILAACLLTLAFGADAGAAPKVFVHHLPGPPDRLDPAKCSNIRCLTVMWPIYESLVDISPDAKTVVPGLAESWVVAPDGLTYTFRLRKNVTFHDGAPFNATAARISLERNYLKGSPFYTADPPNVRETALGGLIREITVRDEHTLTVALKSQKVHFLLQAPMVSPGALARNGKKIAEHPIGTGPFKFARWTGDEIRVAANPAYWGGRPRLDEIAFRIIPQPDRMMQEFLAGRIDFVSELGPDYLERVLASPSTKLLRRPTLSIYYLGFQTDRKPFDDVRVRQAFTRAIDVERAVLFTSQGIAVPAYGPIPPGADAHDPALRKARHDPETARQLLKEAGHTTGVRVSLLFNDTWAFLSELAQAVKADLGKVGVTVDLVPVSGYKKLVADVRKGAADMFIYNWAALFADSEIFLAPLFQTGSVENLTRYSNPKVDALLEQARPPMEPAARRELYRKAQALIVDDAPAAFLFHRVRMSAYNTRVSGLELNLHSFPVDRFVRVEVRAD